MESSSFIKLLSSEIDRASTSITNQNNCMNNIIENSSNILLQIEEFIKSKRKINENDIKYVFNRATILDLVKVAENYSRVISLHEDSYRLQTQTEYMSRSDEFRNFQENIGRNSEYLASCIRRLQALKDNVRNMQTELNSMTKIQLIPNYAESDENSPPTTPM